MKTIPTNPWNPNLPAHAEYERRRDYEEYTRLWKDMMDLLRERNPLDQMKIKELFGKIETIKNRHGGFPPRRP